jgi:hypothetical protein
MWSVIVVVLSPSFNLRSGIVQRQESVFIQALGTNPPLSDSMNVLFTGLPGRLKSRVT